LFEEFDNFCTSMDNPAAVSQFGCLAVDVSAVGRKGGAVMVAIKYNCPNPQLIDVSMFTEWTFYFWRP